MEVGVEKDIIVVRLADGEEILDALNKVAEKHAISSGILLTGIGMLRDFTLGYYNGCEYQRTDLSDPHELVSLQGSFAECDGEMIVHVHGNLAGKDSKSIGGHIFGGTVNGLAEISIRKLTEITLYREENEGTGLKEMHIS